MTQTRIRTALMDGTVRVVARDGLDKLTTRSIANKCGLHDAYIYRYFGDKEDLLKKTFLREDSIITHLVLKNALTADQNDDLKINLTNFWMPAWQYLTNNPDACKFYVRYYYSAHFEKDAAEDFKRGKEELKKAFIKALPDEADAELLFYHNIDTIMQLSMKVASGRIEKTDDIFEKVYDLMYRINCTSL